MSAIKTKGKPKGRVSATSEFLELASVASGVPDMIDIVKKLEFRSSELEKRLESN